VADLLEGAAALPSEQTMRKGIEREMRAMGKRYLASKRHTIEVDFFPYQRTIKRERKRSARHGRLRAMLGRGSQESRVETG